MRLPAPQAGAVAARHRAARAVTIAQIWPSGGATEAADLLDSYPRGACPTLRMNFVASADGAAASNGLSGGLSGPADRVVFATLRMVCDALVVAAGTIRAEHYDALRLDASSRNWRRAQGLPELPLMVIVSGALELDPEQLIFADAPIPPVILTHASAPADRRAALNAVAEIITVGADQVDLAVGIAELHRRGATQILCEGGPRLFGSLIAADLVDELCLTVSPLLAGGAAGRIATGPPTPPRRLALRHILAADDMLFLRYVRTVSATGTPSVVDIAVDDH